MDHYIRNCLKTELCQIKLNSVKCGDAIKQKIDDNDCCIDDDERIGIFLKGYCTAFAIALNKIFGYDIYKTIKGDVHYFCKVKSDNIFFYIDVRGIMNKSQDCLDYFNATIDDIELDSNKTCWDDENIDVAIRYAEALIEKYKSYYSIK